MLWRGSLISALWSNTMIAKARTLDPCSCPDLLLMLCHLRCAPRCLRLELPCPELLGSTLHYLYTGELPGELTRKVAAPDLEHLFGLIANAKFLLCDELIKDCMAIIKTCIKTLRRGDHYKPVIAHPSICPDLVPTSFIAEILVDNAVPPGVRLEMVLAWVERTEGAFPEADHDHLRPLLETFTTGRVIVDDTTWADLCQRFATGAAVFGPELLIDMGKRLARRAREVDRLAGADRLRGSSASGTKRKLPWRAAERSPLPWNERMVADNVEEEEEELSLGWD
jgi:hypothetical protein